MHSEIFRLSYYPSFGSLINEMVYTQDTERYRYGFNGMEKDNETTVAGGSYDFGARIYDSRLGRWLAQDPFLFKYPDHSPYSFAQNAPTFYMDKGGKDIILSDFFINSVYYSTALFMYTQMRDDPFIIRYVQPFLNNNSSNNLYLSYHIVYNVNQLCQPETNPSQALAITLNKSSCANVPDQPTSIRFNSGKVLRFDPSSGDHGDGKREYFMQSNLSKALTIAHELIHTAQFNGTAEERHQAIATTNHIEIVNFLSNFATSNSIDLTYKNLTKTQVLDHLAFSGCEETEAFITKYGEEGSRTPEQQNAYAEYDDVSRKFLWIKVELTEEERKEIESKDGTEEDKNKTAITE